MPLKQWTYREPINSNDLNLNFLGLDLRLQALEQTIAALRNGIGSGGSGSSAPIVLAFSDASPAQFSDGSDLTFSG